MELRRDLLLGVGALVAFNLMMAFGAIGLLMRMSPAIGLILEDNVASIEAAEEMLAILAETSNLPAALEQRQRFDQALERAQRNITEDEERAALVRLEQSRPAALEGDTAARLAVVLALQDLVRINRNAMRETDREARRMGTAGAWSTAFIALLGFVLSLIVARRLRLRILVPLADLYGTLEAARTGDPYRRCKAVQAPFEIKRIFGVVNALLDRQHSPEQAADSAEPGVEIEHLALLHLLEKQPDAAFIVDDEGHIVATNKRGLARLGEADGEALRQALRRIPASRKTREASTIEAVPLADGAAWYCTLGRPVQRRAPSKWLR